MKSVTELINTKEPAWTLFVQQWIKDAKNPVEVLPKDKAKADSSLYKSQVTTRSPMGAIIYETGGILVDSGWIRILGSGSEKLDRNLMDWNKGKTFSAYGQQIPYLLIADDVLGGFFAINGGGLDTAEIGKVFYFAPDNLLWESIGYTYTEFIVFCFSGNIKKFYESFYWTDWEKDLRIMDGNQGISCFPFLCTTEGKDINKVSRKAVPIKELWLLHNDLRKQFVTGEK
ncbi:MAG: DUF2625 domain-containing protein [Bacteroidia bacterium]|nr:DUF2625 domain-containing protein [Bacteroidia bacterium]